MFHYHPAIAPIAAGGWNQGTPAYPNSVFGSGIVTWRMPFLFRTSPGYNLLVRGPTNLPKHGIACLDGLIETDWSPPTFTLNWRFTAPDVWVQFGAGDPLCMLVPQRRGELEQFDAVVAPIESDAELRALWQAWNQSRCFYNDHLAGDPHAKRATGQNAYTRGELPDGTTAPEHQTRLKLCTFKEQS